jgi:predicted ATP-dependent protease
MCGVTEMIEGFNDVCPGRGLTGGQGVILPESNVRHLMLKEEVVQAVANGTFHLWSVSHVDEAIELLTGIPAGERGADGTYPADSINGRVENTLKQFVLDLRAFNKPGKDEKEDNGEAPDAAPTF